MCDARFTIRFRRARHPDRLTVVLEDEAGAAYLLSRRGRRFRLTTLRAGERLVRGLDGRGWQRVPEVSPYSLTELQHLLARPA
jgi:hypothetical protein